MFVFIKFDGSNGDKHHGTFDDQAVVATLVEDYARHNWSEEEAQEAVEQSLESGDPIICDCEGDQFDRFIPA